MIGPARSSGWWIQMNRTVNRIRGIRSDRSMLWSIYFSVSVVWGTIYKASDTTV
jgi:hypothetical protein